MTVNTETTRTPAGTTLPDASAAARLKAYATSPGLGARLQALLPALREDPWRLRGLRVERFTWKGPLAAEGSMILIPARSESSPPDAMRRFFRIEPAPRSERAEDDHAFFGYDADAGMELRVSPCDPALPELETILSGEHDAGGEPLSDLRLLGHRFGRRATLAARFASGQPLLVKVFARKRAERLARTLRSLAEPDAAGTRGGCVPRVLRCDRKRNVVFLEYLQGSTLQGSWSSVRADALRDLGDMVYRLSQRGVPHGDRWTVAHELDTIRRFVERLTLFDPELAAGLGRAANAPAPPDATDTGRIHRDLHDGQVVLGPDGPGIIDWDLAAAGSPAVDAGNFAAHVRLGSLQEALPPEHASAMRDAFLTGFTAARGTSEGLRGWERLALLRLVGVYGLRPDSGRVARGLLREANHLEVSS